jgi:UDP-glucose 4-epimerase
MRTENDGPVKNVRGPRLSTLIAVRVVVTGGAGFIGSHIVDALVAQGDEVAVIDDFSTGGQANINPAADVHRLDIGSAEAAGLIRSFKPEAVSHQAAQMSVARSVRDPLFDARVNVLGGLNIVEAAAEAGARFVFASTGGAMYGDADVLPTPETYRPWPVSPYGVAKLSLEHYLHSYRAQGRIRYIALRYANVYGPRQNPHGEAGVVAIFSRAILEGRMPVINGDGRQTRDYIDVSDVVAANLAAMRSEEDEGVFNIGTGRQVDVNTVFDLLRRSLGSDAEATHGPAKPEQRTSALDSTLAAQKLDWRPRVDFETGIAATANWFREHP